MGRTPHGVRGLKFNDLRRVNGRPRRTPHGVRGLKYYLWLGIFSI